ncbi:MAG: helix-turn-helix transcriptional regulator [Luteimonas sp.]
MPALTDLNPIMLGQSFKAERIALGKTQQAIATAAGCRRQTIVDLEAGRNVSLHTVFAALAALGKGLVIADARPDLDRVHLLLDQDDAR